MSFLLKNAADQKVLHENTLTEKDFNQKQVNDDWIHVNFPTGKLSMRQWIFDGVRMGYSDGSFTEKNTFDWKGDLDVITMYFSLKGAVSIGSGPHDTFELGNNQQNMFYGKEASGFMKMDELKIKSFMLQFNTEAFLRIASGGTDELKYFADQVAAQKTTSFAEKGFPIDTHAQTAIDAIMNCKFHDSLKRIFFLSKAMELLVLHADSYTRWKTQKQTHVKTDYDKDRILFARDYILQHLDMPPTIPELSKIAGINEFKLKKGYKEIFGTTIFGHIAEERLKLANEALREGSKSISAIAFELGYSSVQHFSAAFKKKFGFSPSKGNKA